MATINSEIEFQGNDDTWFTTNASIVYDAGIVIYHTDGRYKFADGVTALSALPFLGGASTENLAQVLANGNTTGQLVVKSDDGLTTLSILNQNAYIEKLLGNNVYFLGIANNEVSLSFYDDTTGVSNSVVLSNYGVTLTDNNVVNLNAPSIKKNNAELATLNDLPTLTSQLTNDGSDAVNPFITAVDLPNKATQSTNKIGTNDNTYVTPLANAIKPNASFVVCHARTNINMSDNTSYYFGTMAWDGATISQFLRLSYLGVDCKIVGATITLLVNQTPGTSEDIPFYIQVNGTTDYFIGNLKGNTLTQQIFINTSLNVPLTSTDYFTIKFATPAFVSNPTNTVFGATLSIR